MHLTYLYNIICMSSFIYWEHSNLVSREYVAFYNSLYPSLYGWNCNLLLFCPIKKSSYQLHLSFYICPLRINYGSLLLQLSCWTKWKNCSFYCSRNDCMHSSSFNSICFYYKIRFYNLYGGSLGDYKHFLYLRDFRTHFQTWFNYPNHLLFNGGNDLWALPSNWRIASCWKQEILVKWGWLCYSSTDYLHLHNNDFPLPPPIINEKVIFNE